MRRILFALVLLAVVIQPACGLAGLRTKQACIKDCCINVEVADTDETRARGLMYRGSLAETRGMLFVFPDEGMYNFWMLNMRFAIDIIWISKECKIVDIKKNVQPCTGTCESLIPGAKAAYVLEVQSGFSARNDLNLGDAVTFDKSTP